MRASKITRPNGQVFLVHDDGGSPAEYTYARERTDIEGRSYWQEAQLDDRASATTVLDIMREVTFGDATVEVVVGGA